MSEQYPTPAVLARLRTVGVLYSDTQQTVPDCVPLVCDLGLIPKEHTPTVGDLRSLLALVAAQQAMLKLLGTSHSLGLCPICSPWSYGENDHAPGCALAALLAVGGEP